MNRTLSNTSAADLVPLFLKLEAVGKKAGHAFGLDTADRNALDTCERCIRPNDPTLRRWVAERKASQTTSPK